MNVDDFAVSISELTNSIIETAAKHVASKGLCFDATEFKASVGPFVELVAESAHEAGMDAF